MSKKLKTQDDITRDMLSTIRRIQETSISSSNKLLTEEVDSTNKSDAIAITDEPKFGQNALTNQIQQFRSSVESGAQFSKVDINKISECPLIYMPSTGKDNMQILNKLFGFYQNWREQWNSESADLERMVQNLQNK